MNREMKQEVHEYCKNREQRKNRYANKMKDKQKRREDNFFLTSFKNKTKWR